MKQVAVQLPSEAALVVGDLTLDPASGLVWRAGVPIDLSPTERRVLTALLACPDAPVTTKALVEAAWGAVSPSGAAYLAVYIDYLRRKLEANPAKPGYLRAAKDGYTFRTTPTASRTLPVQLALRPVF